MWRRADFEASLRDLRVSCVAEYRARDDAKTQLNMALSDLFRYKQRIDRAPGIWKPGSQVGKQGLVAVGSGEEGASPAAPPLEQCCYRWGYPLGQPLFPATLPGTR